MMKTWLNELRKKLDKKFYKEEVDEIVSYYEEMIEERKAKGESIDHILASYDINVLMKNITPEIVMKREHKTYLSLSKSTKQVILVLLSTPLLIPIGVTYVALIVTAVSLLIASVAMMFAGSVALISYLITLFSSTYPLIDHIGLLGIGLIGFSVMVLSAILLAKIVFVVIAGMLNIFAKVLKRGREHYETV